TAGFVGPAIAGVLLATSGAGWALILDAATFAVGAWLLSRLRIPALPASVRTSFRRELAEGWREVASRRWLWASIVSFALFQLVVLASMSVLGPVVAKRSLGGSSAWALIAAGFGVGSLAGNLVALHIRPRRPLVTAYALFAGSVPSLFLLGAAAPAPLIAATEVLAGLAIGVGGVLWETTLQEQVPRESYGRVVSWDWMGSTLLRPVGLAIAGPLADLIGVRATLYGAGTILLANMAALLAVPEVRSMRAGPRSAHEHVPPVLLGEEPLPDDQAREM
ncbi:MAG: hypothetical protein QOE36_114, partial [Gaiellaceae bacterium]|nr:hypothetical protein [Gaiellaceae bacterium]